MKRLSRFCDERVKDCSVAVLALLICGAVNGTAAAADRCNPTNASDETVSERSCSGPGTGSGTSRLAQLAPAPSPPAPSGGLLPADRMVAWNPGLMSIGGIPNRTTVYKSPFAERRR